MEKRNDKSLMEQKAPKLLEGLRKGLSISAACRCAALPRQTFYYWRNCAEKQSAKKIYKDFEAQCIEAQAEGLKSLIAKLDEPYIDTKVTERFDAENNLLSKKITTKTRTPNNAKWLLSRMHPELFNERVIVAREIAKLTEKQTQSYQGPRIPEIIERVSARIKGTRDKN